MRSRSYDSQHPTQWSACHSGAHQPINRWGTSLSRLKRVDVPSAQLSEEFLAQRLESAAHLAPAMGLGWQVEYDRGGQDGIRIG